MTTTVLCDLDELKKVKEGARESIKWLETEIKKGNRFLKIQRENESLQIPLVKIPSKLGKRKKLKFTFLYILNSHYFFLLSLYNEQTMKQQCL